jgi:hypothetical protein
MVAAFGQAGFRPGFIIKNNGDTLNGLVFYSVDGKFKNTCRFKRFEIAQEFSYGPSKMKAFGFRNGRYFESKGTGNRKSFYECMLKGEISVFVRPGKSGGQVYLESPETGFFKLQKGTNRLAGESYSSYAQAIQYLLDKSGRTSIDASGIRYSAHAIASAITKAGTSLPRQPQAFYLTPPVSYMKDYSVTGTHPLLKIGLNAGYQFLTVNIAGTKYSDYFREAKYNSSYRPVVGLFLNRMLSGKSDHASVELEVNYLTDSYYGYAEYSDGAVINRNDILFDFTAIQIPLYLKYSFGKQKVRPYLKAGGFKSLLIKHSYHRYSEEQFNNEIYTNNITDFDYHGDIGLQGGAGLEFRMGSARSLNLDAMYSYGNQMLKNKRSSEQNTSLETGGFAVMIHMNF